LLSHPLREAQSLAPSHYFEKRQSGGHPDPTTEHGRQGEKISIFLQTSLLSTEKNIWVAN